jgi:hypothetical protein
LRQLHRRFDHSSQKTSWSTRAIRPRNEKISTEKTDQILLLLSKTW